MGSDLRLTLVKRSSANALPFDDIERELRRFLDGIGISGTFRLARPFRAGLLHKHVRIIWQKKEDPIQIHVRTGGRNDVYGVWLESEYDVDQEALYANLVAGADLWNKGNGSIRKTSKHKMLQEDASGAGSVAVSDGDAPEQHPMEAEWHPIEPETPPHDVVVDEPESLSATSADSRFTPGWFRDPELVRLLLRGIVARYPEPQTVPREPFISLLQEETGFFEPIDLALVVKQLKYYGFIVINREEGAWRAVSYRLHTGRMRSYIDGEMMLEEGACDPGEVTEQDLLLVNDPEQTMEECLMTPSGDIEDLLNQRDALTKRIIAIAQKEFDVLEAEIAGLEAEILAAQGKLHVLCARREQRAKQLAFFSQGADH